jgi:hypothetical protein
LASASLAEPWASFALLAMELGTVIVLVGIELAPHPPQRLGRRNAPLGSMQAETVSQADGTAERRAADLDQCCQTSPDCSDIKKKGSLKRSIDLDPR